MANLHDYIAWRGDLSFEAVPPCDIDLLIFSRLAYVPLEGVLDEEIVPQISLAQAAQGVLDIAARNMLPYPYNLKEDGVLLRELRDSPRFSECMAGGFVNIIDLDKGEQFSALTVFLPGGGVVIAIRGTDNTLVGWKENLDLAITTAVPAQLEAVKYLERVAAATDGKLYIAGHSKGGNLAVYGAAFCAPKARRRIESVRSFDGPGFQKQVAASVEFAAITDRTRTILPVSSIVGMLLEHAEDFAVIDSKSAGILQHIPYHWKVVRGDFVYVEERTNSSRFLDATMSEWIDSMSAEQRENLVEGLYSFATAANGRNVQDLLKAKSIGAGIQAVRHMDRDKKEMLEQAFRILRRSVKDSFFVMLERALPKSNPLALKRLRLGSASAARTENKTPTATH